MNLLAIKFGKAISTLRREGIFKGGKRVLGAGWDILSSFNVSSADVLFIAGGVGDSSRYGCVHQKEELEFHGISCSVTVQDNPRLESYADKFKVFIFHRTLHTPKVARLIQKIKQQGKEIIYATDDLVFDSKFFKHMNYLENTNAFAKKMYEGGVGKEILANPYVKVCVTTTSFLQGKLEEYGKKVFVSTNKLSKKDVENANRILKIKEEGNDSCVKIGYFSGTMSHNKDFAEITEALMFILEKYKNTKLVLAGPLDLDSALNKFRDKIEHLPFASREKHFENISNVDINISPLEKNNPFCEAKSELKFFEAGIVEVPTVASATQTFKEAIEDGVDGFVADNTQEWIEKLSLLIENSERRKIMGKKAREKTLKEYTTINSHNEGYYEYLKGIVNGK